MKTRDRSHVATRSTRGKRRAYRAPINDHLEKYNLLESQQRGATAGCSGTMANLLIERIVVNDCLRGNRNISMADRCQKSL